MTPKQRQARLRSIPNNAVLGRVVPGSTGRGNVGLISPNALGSALQSAGAIVVPGTPGVLAPIATHTVLANASGSTAVPTGTTLDTVLSWGNVTGHYNGGSGTNRPASTTGAGFAIGGNFAGFGEVDYWSTVNADGSQDQGHYFYQKTGASAQQLLAAILGDTTVAEIDLYSSGNVCALGITATEYFLAATSGVPFNFYVDGHPTFSLPVSRLGCTFTVPLGGVHTVAVPDTASGKTYTFPNRTGTVIVTPDSAVQGDVLYFNGTDWKVLAPGTDTYVLTTHGASANPTWEAPGGGGSGTVTSIVAGRNLDGGTITISGTIDLQHPLTQELTSNQDATGAMPASISTAGWAITSNFAGVGEVDIWSLVDAVTDQGIFFYQKLTNTTAANIGAFIGNASFGEVLAAYNDVNWAFLGHDTTEGYIGTQTNFPLNVFVNNTTQVAGFPTAGGFEIYGSSSGHNHITVPAAAGTPTHAFTNRSGTIVVCPDSFVQGDVLYHDGTDWKVLAPGTSGQFLKTQGAAANPVWATVSASGGGAGTNWVVKTADYSVLSGDTGKDIANTGASANINLTLPAAAANLVYGAYVDAAHEVKFTAGTGDVIQYGANASASAGNIKSSTVGSYLRLSSPKANLWVVMHDTGSWTVT